MGADREIELKFLCARDDFAAVLAAAPEGPETRRDYVSIYYDTADQALARRQATLRVRETRGRRVQTLKLGAGISREEHEIPVVSMQPDPDHGPLKVLLDARELSDLSPAFEVHVTRIARVFSYGSAQIELALDEGEVRSGRRAAPICEVELELKSGPLCDLFGAARLLAKAAPLQLSLETKADRGRALNAPRAAWRDKKTEPRPPLLAQLGELRAKAQPGALGQDTRLLMIDLVERWARKAV